MRDQEPKGRGREDVSLFAAHNAKRFVVVYLFHRQHGGTPAPGEILVVCGQCGGLSGAGRDSVLFQV